MIHQLPQVSIMDALIRILVLGAAFCQLSLGAPSSAGQENCNTSTNRACWISGTYDINTDYESNTPLTGVVRKVDSFFKYIMKLF